MYGLIRILCAAAVYCVPLAAADNQLTPQERRDGWQLLFDGKTFAGWDDPAKKSPAGDAFAIEDGCIRTNPHPRITEDLFTTAKFSDFELEFDWKIAPGGNSGVKYRIQDHVFLEPGQPCRFEDCVAKAMAARPRPRLERGQDYVIGFEFQLHDNAVLKRAGDDVHKTGALYDMIAPAKDASRAVGEWNHARLVVRGNHIEHWLNGEKVIDSALDAPAVRAHTEARWGAGGAVSELLVKHARRECPISLQNHDTAAWFKNIKIRRLSPL